MSKIEQHSKLLVLPSPMLLGALSKNTSDSAGAESLNNALHQHSGDVPNNVADSLSNEATMQDGAAILGHILGGQETNVAAGLGQMSGLDADTAEINTYAPLSNQSFVY